MMEIEKRWPPFIDLDRPDNMCIATIDLAKDIRQGYFS